MNDIKKGISPLVKVVTALDDHFTELDRLGTKINTMDLKSEFDLEQAQRLMNRFAEVGQGVSTEVVNLSTQLNEVRARAEAVAQGVSARAEELNTIKTEQQKKIDEFKILGDKVRDLSASMTEYKPPEGSSLSDNDREKLAAYFAEVEMRVAPLVEQAKRLRTEAHQSNMKTLAHNADAMTQTLQAVRQKLSGLNLTQHLPQT